MIRGVETSPDHTAPTPFLVWVCRFSRHSPFLLLPHLRLLELGVLEAAELLHHLALLLLHHLERQRLLAEPQVLGGHETRQEDVDALAVGGVGDDDKLSVLGWQVGCLGLRVCDW